MLLRLLSLLVTIQTLLCAFLLFKMNLLENQLILVLSDTSQISIFQQDDSPTPPPLTQSNTLDAQGIRHIVREELNQFANKAFGYKHPKATQGRPATVEEQNALQRAQDLLELYTSQGQVNYSELETFYASLDNLRADDRKQTLRKLAVSINSGLIKLNH
jgi:hypothetical protein